MLNDHTFSFIHFQTRISSRDENSRVQSGIIAWGRAASSTFNIGCFKSRHEMFELSTHMNL